MFVLTLIFMILEVHYMRHHLNLVLNNNTTFEYIQAKQNNRNMVTKYNVGTSENWKQIFGENKMLWFLPVRANLGEFRGINYPLRNNEN
jgi:palmitoyltransferase